MHVVDDKLYVQFTKLMFEFINMRTERDTNSNKNTSFLKRTS